MMYRPMAIWYTALPYDIFALQIWYNIRSFICRRHISSLAERCHIGDISPYCSILEHMAEDGNKCEASQAEIDALINHVKDSTLSCEEKNQLISFLGSGRRLSARQKCINLLNKFAKHSYDGYTPKKIFDEAYSLRSAFAHGNSPRTIKASFL